MTLLDLLPLLAIGAGAAWLARILRTPRRRLLTADDPALTGLGAALGLTTGEDGLTGERDGIPVQLRVSTGAKGPRTEAIVPIRARMPVGFLVSRRDPRIQRGAPLGVPRLDRWLQVYTSDTRIPDDLSWLSGQVAPLGDNLNTPGAVRFLAEAEVAARLEALLPTAREGSRVNAAAVVLIEDGSSSDAAERLLDEAAGLALAIERAADPWQPVATSRGLTFGPYDEDGDRVLSGTVSDLQVRAELTCDEDGDIEATVVTVSPLRAATRIEPGDGGLRLNNPILDHRLIIETGDGDEDSLRERLNAPEAAADLMEVFGTWPASRLTEGHLRVRAPDRAGTDDLAQMIDAAVRCALRVG